LGDQKYVLRLIAFFAYGSLSVLGGFKFVCISQGKQSG
jgi:hypothetical protein